MTSKVLNEGVDVPSANVAIVISGSGLGARARAAAGPHLAREDGKRAICTSWSPAHVGERSPASGGGSTLLTADSVNVRRKGASCGAAARRRPRRAPSSWPRSRAGRGARRAQPRGAGEARRRAVEVAPRERRLADGIGKLVEIAASSPRTPGSIRGRALGATVAACLQRGRGARGDTCVGHVDARGRRRSASGRSRAAVERALYADLLGAQASCSRMCRSSGAARGRLRSGAGAGGALARGAGRGGRVGAPPGRLSRALPQAEVPAPLVYDRRADGGYRVEIDGPFSLFESVTKYGLQLALALPAIGECGRWCWRPTCVGAKSACRSLARRCRCGGQAGRRGDGPGPPRLTDEGARLLDARGAGERRWSAAPSTDILSPGRRAVRARFGVHPREDRPARVSRGARLLEPSGGVAPRRAVERGLQEHILFAVSQRLRVSEEALGDEQPGALFVYAR